MIKHLFVSLAACFAAALAAAPALADDDAPEGGHPPRWGLGVGVVATDSPYAGEGTRTTPFPLLSYQGERFYFRGITAGWRFIDRGGFTLAAVAQARLDGFDIDDLGREELAGNGLDYTLLEDRDDGLDLGLAAEWSGAAGEVGFEILADATDTSGGQEVSLGYGYPFQFGETRVTPNAGVRWLSEDMANYYYGTLDEEVARGVVDYKPDAITIPHVGVEVARPLGEKWFVFASLEYRSLPNEIERSPLIERDRDDETSLLLGVSRGF